jgi:hypothetical protein
MPLPTGFHWTWAGDTVRIDLPRIERTDAHVLVPMLTRGDAEELADAIVLHDRKRQRGPERAGSARPLARIVLAHSPRYAAEALSKFREKLAFALLERGPKVTIDEMETMSGEEPEPEVEGA